MLYQVTVNDLAYFKTQQWLLTYYTLLVFSALVAAARVFKNGPSCVDRAMLIGLGFLLAIGAEKYSSNFKLPFASGESAWTPSLIDSAPNSKLHGVRT